MWQQAVSRKARPMKKRQNEEKKKAKDKHLSEEEGCPLQGATDEFGEKVVVDGDPPPVDGAGHKGEESKIEEDEDGCEEMLLCN